MDYSEKIKLGMMLNLLKEHKCEIRMETNSNLDPDYISLLDNVKANIALAILSDEILQKPVMSLKYAEYYIITIGNYSDIEDKIIKKDKSI